MRSSPFSASWCRLPTDARGCGIAGLAAVALSATLSGCGADVCGPGDAGASGLTADIGGGAPLAYGSFTSSPNNDCTPGERMPTSLTVGGTQVGQPGFHMTLCIPRPDHVPSGAIDIVDSETVQVIDVNGRVDPDCVLTLDRTRTGSGTLQFAGYCGDGLDEAGYALVLNATLPGTKTCGATADAVDIVLSGAVSVSPI